MSELHKKFPRLLFFSMAKLVHLSQMLALNDGNLGRLVQEIGFLFQPKGSGDRNKVMDNEGMINS